LRSKASRTKVFEKWLSEGQRKIVLKVKDLSELETIEKKARSEKMVTEMIIDAGLTEVPPETVTCLGIGPGNEQDIDKITGHLKLA